MSSSGRKTKRPHQPTLKFLEHMEQVRNKQRRTESTQPVALKKCSVPIQRLTEEQIRKWSRAEVSGNQNQQSRTDIVRYFPSTHMLSSSGRKTKRPHHPTLKFLELMEQVRKKRLKTESTQPVVLKYCTVPIQRLTEEQIRKWSRAEVSGDQNQQSQADVVRNDEDSQPSGEELQLSESFEHLSLHDDIEDSESPRDVEDWEQSRSCAGLEEDPLENSKEVMDEALAISTEQTPDVEDGEQSRSCAGLEEDPLENSKEVIDEALAISTEQTASCSCPEEETEDNPSVNIDERSLGSRSESPWSDGPFFPVHVQPPELPIQASYVRSANPAWQQVIDDDIFRYLYEPSSPNPNISSEVIMYAERMRHLDMIDDCIAAYSRMYDDIPSEDES